MRKTAYLLTASFLCVLFILVPVTCSDDDDDVPDERGEDLIGNDPGGGGDGGGGDDSGCCDDDDFSEGVCKDMVEDLYSCGGVMKNGDGDPMTRDEAEDACEDEEDTDHICPLECWKHYGDECEDLLNCVNAEC